MPVKDGRSLALKLSACHGRLGLLWGYTQGLHQMFLACRKALFCGAFSKPFYYGGEGGIRIPDSSPYLGIFLIFRSTEQRLCRSRRCGVLAQASTAGTPASREVVANPLDFLQGVARSGAAPTSSTNAGRSRRGIRRSNGLPPSSATAAAIGSACDAPSVGSPNRCHLPTHEADASSAAAPTALSGVAQHPTEHSAAEASPLTDFEEPENLGTIIRSNRPVQQTLREQSGMSEVTREYYSVDQLMEEKVVAMKAWSDALIEAFLDAGGKLPAPSAQQRKPKTKPRA